MTARLAAVVAGTSTVCLLVGWVVLCWEQLRDAIRALLTVPQRDVRALTDLSVNTASVWRDAEPHHGPEDLKTRKGKGF